MTQVLLNLARTQKLLHEVCAIYQREEPGYIRFLFTVSRNKRGRRDIKISFYTRPNLTDPNALISPDHRLREFGGALLHQLSQELYLVADHSVVADNLFVDLQQGRIQRISL